MLNLKFMLRAVALLFASMPGALYASHAVAGHISYEMTGPMTAHITLVTYSDPSEALIDRCTADFEIWEGTGSSKVSDIPGVPRKNGPLSVDSQFPNITCPSGIGMGEYVYHRVKRNVYDTTFTFPSAGTYLIRYSDLARFSYVHNMIGSESMTMYLEAMITVGSPAGEQNSVVLLNHLWNTGLQYRRWTFNPGAYDPDGDSLAFEFMTPLQYDPPTIPSPIPVTGYQNLEDFGSNGPLSLDSISGLVSWDMPWEPGLYVFAVKISEYRNGTLIGQSHYDKLVRINTWNNQPPVIQAIRDTTILPGDTLRLDFMVWDQDPIVDTVYFMLNNVGIGLNSAFRTQPPATVNLSVPGPLPVSDPDTIFGSIEWATTPAMARSAPYQIDLYAHDNNSYANGPSIDQLSAHHVILVYVQAPVGLAESTEEIPGVDVFPNPAREKVNIVLEKAMAVDYELRDASGRKALEGGFRGMGTAIDTEGLPAGLYLLRVSSGGKSSVIKLLLGH